MPRLSENRTAPYDGRFINANAATLALTGLSLEALKATTFQQFIVPEDLPDALARFYQAVQARAKSFGIKGMNERARAFNGTVRINGSPGEGTTVCIKFPMLEPGRAA